MKIRVSVTETRYGYIDVIIPDDSVITDPHVSSGTKRRQMKRLAEKALERGEPVVWDADSRDVIVHLGGSIIDNEEEENGDSN